MSNREVRRVHARYQPRCRECGRFWSGGSGGEIYYPPGPAVPGDPTSGPHDEVYVCARCFVRDVEELNGSRDAQRCKRGETGRCARQGRVL